MSFTNLRHKSSAQIFGTNLRHKSSAQIFGTNLRHKSSVGLPSQMVEPQPPNYINVPDKPRWIEAP